MSSEAIISECHYIMIANTYLENNKLFSTYTDLFNFLKLLLKFGKITEKIKELKTLIYNSIDVFDLNKNKYAIDQILIIEDINKNSNKNELDNKYYSIYFNLSQSDLINRLQNKCNMLNKISEIKNIIFIVSGHGYENKIDDGSKVFGGFYSNDLKEINLAKIVNIFNNYNQYLFIDACRSIEKIITKKDAIDNYSFKTNKKITILFPSSKYNTTAGSFSKGRFLISKLI